MVDPNTSMQPLTKYQTTYSTVEMSGSIGNESSAARM